MKQKRKRKRGEADFTKTSFLLKKKNLHTLEAYKTEHKMVQRKLHREEHNYTGASGLVAN